MRWPVASLALLVLLAGCGDSSDPEPAPTTTEDPTPGPAASATPSDTPATESPPEPRRDPVTWEVEVRDNSFAPAELTIQAGDTVAWVRIGNLPHTATADDGTFDSGNCPGLDCFGPATRQSFSFTFGEVGSWPYHCEVHSTMVATIDALERHDAVPEA